MLRYRESEMVWLRSAVADVADVAARNFPGITAPLAQPRREWKQERRIGRGSMSN